MTVDWERALKSLESIAESLRKLSERDWGTNPDESREAKAIRILAERGASNISAIAKAVGVSRATLYNWPAFREALNRVRGSSYWQLRDPRSVESGDTD